MKTYYIVQHAMHDNHQPFWMAHSNGFAARLGQFGHFNSISDTISFKSADVCEEKLRNILSAENPRVVRVVHI